MDTKPYCCKRCGRAIFDESQVIGTTNLWDFGDYQAECYRLSDAVDLSGLRRYDASLHEGWYCCRFMVMRMVVDKFGTGRDLLVYADSVTRDLSVKENKSHAGQIRLTARDFDTVVNAPTPSLKVVKFGAIWCPPCRLMDTVIERIDGNGGIPGVEFFEIDIDEEHALAERFRIASVPTFFFYKSGKLLHGSFSGALPRQEFEVKLHALAV